MTTEDLLAMPDDGVERYLFEGQLREMTPHGEDDAVTVRNKDHGETQISTGSSLLGWVRQQPSPRGKVVGGETGFLIRQDPDTTVGVDVAYVAPEVIAATPKKARFFHGPPLLVVEILSPSDQHEEVMRKVEDYLAAGVKIVWVANTTLKTIIAHRADARPKLYDDLQEIDAEPHLPGYRAKVADLFG